MWNGYPIYLHGERVNITLAIAAIIVAAALNGVASSKQEVEEEVLGDRPTIRNQMMIPLIIFYSRLLYMRQTIQLRKTKNLPASNCIHVQLPKLL